MRMKNIIRVEKLTKNKIEQLEDVINNYIALLEDETIVDIKLYNNQHEILPTTAYLFISKTKEKN